MKHVLPVLAVALAAFLLTTQVPAAKAAEQDTAPDNFNQGGTLCNCTEWSCPRSSNYYCPPGPKCQHGVCTPIVAPDGSACIVTNKCEVAPGTCLAGICKGKYQKICPAHPAECKVYKCRSPTGICDLVDNKPDGTACKGGSCKDGNCIPNTRPSPSPRPPPSPKPCRDPSNPCKVSTRDPKTGKCKVQNADDGTSCNDRNKCTVGDACKRGRCTGRPRKCKEPENPCKQSTCDPFSGKCSLSNLPDDTKCPNGTCTAGVCIKPTPQSCPIPKDPCKVSEFNTTLQECQLKPGNEGASCTDRDKCTTGDKCQAGVCTGISITCDPTGNSCTENKCNPGTGICEAKKVDDGTKCDDGLFCTVDDACMNGQCSGIANLCTATTKPCEEPVCDESSNTCTFRNKMDGSPCTSGITDKCATEMCMAGQCVVSNRTDCSSSDDACNKGTCNPTTGVCEKAPKPDGIACEDGLFCTKDTTCLAGTCQNPSDTCSGTTNSTAQCGSSLEVCCEARRQCLTIIDDSCSKQKGQCYTSYCDSTSGTCQQVPINENKSCDDGKTCTTDDKCNGGECKGTPLTCTGTVGQCKKMVCVEGVGCKEVNQDNGTPCNAGNGLCSSDTCQDGQCIAGTPRNCSCYDGPCTTGACNIETGECYPKKRPDNTPCDDGDSCTENSVCTAGKCIGVTDKVCAPIDKCHVATCNPITGCVNTPVNCSSLDDQCKKGKCDPNTGACMTVPINTGDSCTNDDLYCKVNLKCQADGSCDSNEHRDCSGEIQHGKCQTATCDEVRNKCVVTELDCSKQGAGQCTAGVCGPNGQCTTMQLKNGTTCNDGKDDTCKDVCTNGECAGTAEDCEIPPVSCKDTNACGANECCCGDRNSQICVPKLGGDCGYTCGDKACQKAGLKENLVCHCIKSCGVDGSSKDDQDAQFCSSVGGNPCAPNGVCCCAKPQTSSALKYGEACPNCKTDCKGEGKVCTGDSPELEAAVCEAPLPPFGSRSGD